MAASTQAAAAFPSALVPRRGKSTARHSRRLVTAAEAATTAVIFMPGGGFGKTIVFPEPGTLTGWPHDWPPPSRSRSTRGAGRGEGVPEVRHGPSRGSKIGRISRLVAAWRFRLPEPGWPRWRNWQTARDLKSLGSYGPYGFESRPRHERPAILRWRPFGRCRTCLEGPRSAANGAGRRKPPPTPRRIAS